MEQVDNRKKLRRYVAQYFDVKDLPNTPGYEPGKTCNVSTVSMFTGVEVNEVLSAMIKRWGPDPNISYQNQDRLKEYMEDEGLKFYPVTTSAGGWNGFPYGRPPTEQEWQNIRNALDKGDLVWFHELGHYTIITGYAIGETGLVSYIEADPAGNRLSPLKDRLHDSGDGAVYPQKFIDDKKLWGQSFGVKV
jgi:hypothetical protein